MRAREIEVRIEELVLHGFSPADRLRIGSAVEHELARLFVEQGLPASFAGAERGAVDAGSFKSGPLATPSSAGRQVARAVYGCLGQW